METMELADKTKNTFLKIRTMKIENQTVRSVQNKVTTTDCNKIRDIDVRRDNYLP